MKTKLFFPIITLLIAASCTPDKIDRFDQTQYKADSITLIADHVMLIADGVSELTLSAKLHRKYTYALNKDKDTTIYPVIPDDRVDQTRVKYYLKDGTPLTDKRFKTADLSQNTITFYAETDGVRSDDFTVLVVKPFAADEITEITYPVVFHLIESKETDDFQQGIGDDYIYYVFNMICNVYERKVVVAPNGADTKIRFRLAEYDPQGKPLAKKGINRVPVKLADLPAYRASDAMLANSKINWNYKDYLNIWIVTGKTTSAVAPKVVMEGADRDKLKGVTLREIPQAGGLDTMKIYNINEIGIVFDAVDFATEDISYSTEIGKYLGLLTTKSSDFKEVDYCDDTFTYKKVDSSSEGNSRLKVTENGLTFLSVNIMDESSFKTVISKDQVSRMRFVTENCPTRWAWKSDWAFTGKKK